jgi:hypothetical protein
LRTSTDHRCDLADLLGRWLPEEAPAAAGREGGGDVAQRLAQWLHVGDAVALSVGLPKVEAARMPARRRGTHGPAERQDLAEQLARLRATLAASIRQHARGAAGEGGDAPEFALYLQRCLDLQRRMELAIGAFHDHARQVLARTSPELARLAMLDVLLGQLLGGRERQGLASVPGALRRRFEQWQRGAAGEGTGPADAEGPGAGFAREFEQVMLAELDTRLRLVSGLVEAYVRHTGG